VLSFRFFEGKVQLLDPGKTGQVELNKILWFLTLANIRKDSSKKILRNCGMESKDVAMQPARVPSDTTMSRKSSGPSHLFKKEKNPQSSTSMPTSAPKCPSSTTMTKTMTPLPPRSSTFNL
jgi:hypothetical protein